MATPARQLTRDDPEHDVHRLRLVENDVEGNHPDDDAEREAWADLAVAAVLCGLVLSLFVPGLS
ncbi:MAG TPA: hypothetical protein VH572_06245 [Gaiella sp.]|jgi:hypothetical protein